MSENLLIGRQDLINVATDGLSGVTSRNAGQKATKTWQQMASHFYKQPTGVRKSIAPPSHNEECEGHGEMQPLDDGTGGRGLEYGEFRDALRNAVSEERTDAEAAMDLFEVAQKLVSVLPEIAEWEAAVEDRSREASFDAQFGPEN